MTLRRESGMKFTMLWCAALLPIASAMLFAQSAASPPDLTGVWGIYRGGPASDPKFRPPAPSPLVLKPEYDKPYQARRAEEAAAAQRGEQLANTSAECIPYGFPVMMSIAIYPVEFIQTPKQVTIISEAFSEVRRVYLDKPQAKIDDVAPGYYGHSVGHWDGDTLVVDTINFNGRTRLDTIGHPHSDALHVIERFTRTDANHIAYEVTIDDPKIFTKPWTNKRTFTQRTDWEIMEYSCEENNKDLYDGHIKPPPH
jgi:hypothetical protein